MLLANSICQQVQKILSQQFVGLFGLFLFSFFISKLTNNKHEQ